MNWQCRLFAAAIVGLLSASPATADDVVIEHGRTKVTQSDLRRSIEATIPARQIGVFYADRRRLSQHAGNFFAVRKLAEMAEERGLTDEEQWRADEARARALSQIQLEYLVNQRQQPDYEQLAVETYRAHPERYHSQESVRVEHVLVGTRERSEEEAEARANEVYELAHSDRDFRELVAEYSDDPSAAQNGGDLGFFARNQMVKPFEDAAFAMEKPGQIVGPVKTPFGFHVLKFVERRPAGLRPFEEVKDAIIAAERDQYRARVVNEVIEEIANLEGVSTNYDALMSLHRPIDTTIGAARSTENVGQAKGTAQ